MHNSSIHIEESIALWSVETVLLYTCIFISSTCISCLFRSEEPKGTVKALLKRSWHYCLRQAGPI